MPRPQGQLDRSLAALTVGVLQGKIERDDQLHHSAGREVTQQVRVPLSGAAGNGYGSAEKKVGWQFPLLWAPRQRKASFKTPHFSYGIELGTGSNTLIVIHAQVVKWTINDSRWVIGANMRFIVSAPMLSSEATVNFSAVAHLSFQGWGAESEEGEIV